MSIIVPTINLIQAVNEKIPGMEWAPFLEDYPASIDTAMLPMALTRKTTGEWQGLSDENEATDGYEITVLVDAINQGEYGYVGHKAHTLLDEFRIFYLSDSTYIVNGTRVLQLTPYRVEIRQPVRDSGITVVEWPIGHDRWWHGFTVSLTVVADSWSCVRVTV